MADISLHRASLVGLWVETLLYGIFLVFFSASIYVLVAKKLHSNVNRPMLAASLLMFFFITAHLTCDVVRALKAFTTDRDPLEYYSNIADPWEWAKTIFYYLLNVVGDTIVLYRCWIVWNKNIPIIILPGLLYLADIVTGALSTRALMRIKPGELIFVKDLAVWVLAFFSLTLTLNAVCTLVIASRIWYITRTTNSIRSSGNNIWTVAIMLIESAAIYSASLFAMIGTYVAKSNSQYVTLDALPPIVGIVFELIIVRVGLGYATDEVHSTTGPGRSNQSTGGNISLQRLGRPRNIDITIDTVVDEHGMETETKSRMKRYNDEV
ncbi:hypothetical protein C8J56DRAFT_168578 [Mycena floridula]|nr:hypothetical protein C8J56DRAFT_168578 [Mycena floridula]